MIRKDDFIKSVNPENVSEVEQQSSVVAAEEEQQWAHLTQQHNFDPETLKSEENKELVDLTVWFEFILLIVSKAPYIIQIV